MSADGHLTKWRRNIAENFNRLSRMHQRYRQTTDGPAMTHSERVKVKLGFQIQRLIEPILGKSPKLILNLMSQNQKCVIV